MSRLHIDLIESPCDPETECKYCKCYSDIGDSGHCKFFGIDLGGEDDT